jgi:hypothetical protein
MTMSGFSLVVSDEGQMVRRGLEDLGADIPKIGRLGVYRTVQRIIKRMRQPGAGIVYPVHWDSDKQRKAFFASEGFGGGVPSTRSGEYQASFDFASLPNGYMVFNDSPGAGFIGGDYNGQGQSMIHVDRWPLFGKVVAEEAEQLPEDVLAELRLSAASHDFEVL